jgi:mono/diheme cytochrome c family protein
MEIRFAILPHTLVLAFCAGIALLACGPDVPQTPASNELARLESRLAPELDEGRALYRANGCETCHGATGEGNGPAGAGLNPPPRNLRDLHTYKQGTSEQAVAQTIFSGIPGSLMQPYPHIKEPDRRLLARYVVYLQKQEQ